MEFKRKRTNWYGDLAITWDFVLIHIRRKWQERIVVSVSVFVIFLSFFDFILNESQMKKKMMIVQPFFYAMYLAYIRNSIVLNDSIESPTISINMNERRMGEKHAHQQKNRNCWIKYTVNLIMGLLHRLKSRYAHNQTVHFLMLINRIWSEFHFFHSREFQYSVGL